MGAQVTVHNDLFLDGSTLRLERVSGSLPTDFDVGLNFDGGSQTLGGSGTVELFNNRNAAEERHTRIRPISGDLTIGAGITLQNDVNSFFTTVGDPALPIVLEGTVAPQTTKPDYTNNALRIVGSTVTNHGTISVTTGLVDAADHLINQGSIEVSGGVLNLNGDWLNGSGGTIYQTAGTIQLGGNFVASDLGAFSGTGGTVSIVGTLLDPGATLAIDSERTWQLAGGTIQGVTIVDDNDGDAAGTLRVTSADGTLDGVTIDVDSLLVPGALVTALNDLTVNGTMTLQTTSVGTTGVEFGFGYGTNARWHRDCRAVEQLERLNLRVFGSTAANQRQQPDDWSRHDGSNRKQFAIRHAGRSHAAVDHRRHGFLGITGLHAPRYRFDGEQHHGNAASGRR